MSDIDTASCAHELDTSAESPFRAWYEDRRKALVEQRRHGRRRADQMVSGGAAGALVLSIGFVDGIAVAPTPELLYLLGGAWIVLLVALATSLGSFITQEKAFREAIENLDEMLQAGEYRPGWEQTPMNDRTRQLNKLAITCLGIGVLGLAAFAWLNLWGVTAA